MPGRFRCAGMGRIFTEEGDRLGRDAVVNPTVRLGKEEEEEEDEDEAEVEEVIFPNPL